MKFLLSVLHDSAALATDAEMAAIDVFNDGLVTAGHWVFAGGLSGPDLAAVIDNRGQDSVITDGPFVETKEHIIGFWIINAPDVATALDLAADGSKACNRKVEVRAFLGD